MEIIQLYFRCRYCRRRWKRGSERRKRKCIQIACTRATCSLRSAPDTKDEPQVSPASAANAVTVGATTSSDAWASYSNFGSAVDILAPGSGITSAWIGSTTAVSTISGTSMATPHITGLVLYLKALEGLATPAATIARLKALGTSAAISGVPSSTINLFAYNGNGA